MAFNRELAAEILRADDRDKARFFAGREREMQSFDDALFGSCQKKQAIFRIFQGAPGCGKTSLAAHLASIHKERSLFVDISDTDDFDRPSLARTIQNEALRCQAGSVAVSVANVAGAFLRNKALTKELGRQAVEVLSSKACFVIHIDEAHSIPARFDPMLKSLHTKGCGVPCIVLLTGLGQTEERVAGIAGMSRLAAGAAVEMRGMSEAECVESTLMMLEALGPEGAPAKRKQAARIVASLSHGWPQHLNRAQKALCEELAATAGSLDRIDLRQIKQRADELRADYYERRTRFAPLSDEPALTYRILVDLSRQRLSKSRARLEKLCADAIEAYGRETRLPTRHLSRGGLADALIERGIVSSSGGHWDVAIPSMSDWAGQALRQAEAPGAPEAGSAVGPVAEGESFDSAP